jgi:hypothetical protein
MARKVKKTEEVITDTKDIIEPIVEENTDKFLDINEIRKIELAQLEEKVRKLELLNMQNQKDKLAANKQLLAVRLEVIEKEIQIADLKILIQTKQYDSEREAYRSFIHDLRAKYDVKTERMGFDLETGRLVLE